MKRVALYAHHGRGPRVARHVLHHAQELRRLGFHVSFISNSPLSAAGQKELSDCCRSVIQLENVGFDFTMWQRGLTEYDLAQVDELLLTNSSIIGPLNPLRDLWRKFDAHPCEFWGLTDNRHYAPHLQSYFLVFRRGLIQSDCFARFWTSVLPYTEKDQVVRSYEVGLTRWLQQGGFKWRAAFPQDTIWRRYLEGRSTIRMLYDRIRNRRLPGWDSTLYYPKLLIDMGMPFLKASLLQPGNPFLHPREAYSLLLPSILPQEVLAELRPHDM